MYLAYCYRGTYLSLTPFPFQCASGTSGLPVSTVSVDANGIITLASAVDYDIVGAPTVLRFTLRASDNPTNGDPSLRTEVPLVVRSATRPRRFMCIMLI